MGHSNFKGQILAPSIRISGKGVKIPCKCWLKREGIIQVSICGRQQEAELDLYEADIRVILHLFCADRISSLS